MQALVLAALCSVLFLGKALLPGYAVMPFPPEVLEPMRSEALAEGRVTAADLQQGNPSFGDKYNQSLAWDRITGDRLRSGDFPLWTRDIAGGAPFVPQQGQPYMPWSWLLPLIPAPGVYGLWYFLHQVVFGTAGRPSAEPTQYPAFGEHPSNPRRRTLSQSQRQELEGVGIAVWQRYARAVHLEEVPSCAIRT